MRFPILVLSAAISAWSVSAGAESVVRCGSSMADIPMTTGQPDRGAGAYQFTGYTIYDPLVAWEMNVAERPGKLVPGLATEWSVDPSDAKKWRFTLRRDVKFHDGSTFHADAVIWNLDKVLDERQEGREIVFRPCPHPCLVPGGARPRDFGRQVGRNLLCLFPIAPGDADQTGLVGLRR